MKTCSIIIAKENSNRFPGKNYYPINGKPLFWHSVELLNQIIDKEHIYICTDSYYIKKYCREKNIYNIIERYGNVNRDDEPYISVLKYAYQYISEPYDIIITILANSINHDKKAILSGMEKMRINPHIEEIRAFDDQGLFSGFCIFRESAVLKPVELHHIAAVISNGREIHYKSEIENAENI